MRVIEQDVVFETGTPVSFTFVRNTEKAPYLGKRFQQHLEPHGVYVLHNEDARTPPNWETGVVSLDFPLVVPFNTEDFGYNETSWKANLVKEYKAKGKRLTQKLLEVGYDAIVTVWEGETREIVVLDPKKVARRNPAKTEDAYEQFHGVEPESATDIPEAWVPGPMVKLGPCVDVGYTILDKRSNKEGRYVHDHEDRVFVYQRPENGERGDLHYKSFPRELWVIGDAIGFTYEDSNGDFQEVKGSKTRQLCTNSAGNILVVVDKKGVLFLVKGGKMRVRDWIYD